jgi:membrane protease subunit HflK
MLINIGLVCLKMFLAVLSGSLALVADAWHSGSDVAASGLVWAGARISRREDRPRLAIAENIVGLVISVLILWAAVGIFSRVSAVAGATIRNLPVAIGGSLIAALVSYYAAQYKLHVGRETGSISLVADGYHSRMDTLTTAAVILGLMGHAIGIELDRIAAVIVAVFIVESGIEIAMASVGGLRGGTAARAGGLAGVVHGTGLSTVAGVLERTGVSALWRGLALAWRSPAARRKAAATAVLVLAVVWALSAVYFVGPGRAGVVLRWGSARAEPTEPGVHVKAPWPIDRVIRVEMPKVRRVEIGFRTRKVPRQINSVAAEFYATLWESRHAAGTYEKLPEEALRLTGDENIVDMNLVVFYTVTDPGAYLFSIAETEEFVRFTAESAMTDVAGRLRIDEVLTLSREDFEGVIVRSVQDHLDDVGAGVRVIGAELQDVHPPLEVVPAFRDVASAREDKNRIINEALAYRDERVPRARGNAERLMREAEGYRVERVDRADGDADRFTAMAGEYRNSRDVTEIRLYLETMESLLAGVEKYIVSSGVELEGYDLRVFDRELSRGAVTQD